MAESIEDQMYYGDHCKHGTNIGTPGGADLMCHWCEMGMDTWVANPAFEMMFEILWDDHVLLQPTATGVTWRANDDVDYTFEKIMKVVEEHQRIANESKAVIVTTYTVVQKDSGYWV